MLVLAGSRSVTEHFFIDPLSGKSYSSDNDHFLGIESVWNNLNYYINMQDCSYGCDVSAHCSHTLLTHTAHTLIHKSYDSAIDIVRHCQSDFFVFVFAGDAV